MENPEDDPREYQQHMPGGFENGYPPGMDGIFGLRQSI
jgi:E3 ubiquitin-protein ligase RNF115/126